MLRGFLIGLALGLVVAFAALTLRAEARPPAQGVWADVCAYRTQSFYNFYGYPIHATVVTALVGNWDTGYRPWPPSDREARKAVADFDCQRF